MQLTLHYLNGWEPEKMFELYGSSSQAMCFEWETKGKSGTVVRELCDNSRYNCSSYAEFTVLCVVKWEFF